MFSHILVPLDESELAEQALAHVGAIAPFNDTLVTLLHVQEPQTSDIGGHTAEPVEWQLGSYRAQSYLTTAGERLAGLGYRVETELIEGDPAVSILEFAKRHDIDLIALTSHGAGGEEIHSLGEVALKTLLSAKTSVLIVRTFNSLLSGPAATREAATRRGYRQVLVPLDGSLRGEAALPYAERLCADEGDSLHLVSVIRPTIPWPAGTVEHNADEAKAAVAAATERAKRYLEGVAAAVAAPQRRV